MLCPAFCLVIEFGPSFLMASSIIIHFIYPYYFYLNCKRFNLNLFTCFATAVRKLNLQITESFHYFSLAKFQAQYQTLLYY